MPNSNSDEQNKFLIEELTKKFKTVRASDPPAGESAQGSIPITAAVPTLPPRHRQQLWGATAAPPTTLPTSRRRKKQALEQEQRKKLLQWWSQLQIPQEKKLEQWNLLQQLSREEHQQLSREEQQLELLKQWHGQLEPRQEGLWEHENPCYMRRDEENPCHQKSAQLQMEKEELPQWQQPWGETSAASAPALPPRRQPTPLAKQPGAVPRKKISEKQKKPLKPLPPFPSDEQPPSRKQSGAMPRRRQPPPLPKDLQQQAQNQRQCKPDQLMAQDRKQRPRQQTLERHDDSSEAPNLSCVLKRKIKKYAEAATSLSFFSPSKNSHQSMPSVGESSGATRRTSVNSLYDTHPPESQLSLFRRESVNSLYATHSPESQPSLSRHESENSLYDTHPPESQSSLFRQHPPEAAVRVNCRRSRKHRHAVKLMGENCGT